MNWDQVEGKWDQFTGKLRQQWGKLTDDDFEQIKGKRDELVGRLKERYGLEKEKAELEIDRWMKTLAVALALGAAVLVSSPAFAADAPPDAWLTTKAKIGVLTATGTGGTDINVDTVRGKVTLHGTVATEGEKDAAEKAAREVDGVVEVRNLLQVVKAKDKRATDANDENVREAIVAKFKADSALEKSDIKVQSVNDGTVLLAGEAPDLLAHLRAVEIARNVPGVVKVASEIESPDASGDAEVWKTLEAEPKSDVSMTDKAKGLAAGAVSGTKDMASKVGDKTKSAWSSVSGSTKDAYLTSAVKTRLLADDDTPGTDINVDTEDGVVTLWGTVDSAKAKKAAESEAKKVSGVKSVRNKLEVSDSRGAAAQD